MLIYRQRCRKGVEFKKTDSMSENLYRLLVLRGISSSEEAEEFLNPGKGGLEPAECLSGMKEAVDRIEAAIAAGDPICVYGDYDVDGISAVAILASYLEERGAKVERYIPSRHSEGYGINESAVRELAARNKLLVTVDCGINSAELIELAKQLNMDSIVTDHHIPDGIPPRCPVLNPVLNGWPDPLCGAGVALKLVQAMDEEAAMDRLDLAALATVADIVPLVGENRAIVKLGLDAINSGARPGIRTLMEVAHLEGTTVGAGHIAFMLAPRLNAGGRLGSACHSLELLTTNDVIQASKLACELDEQNTMRKRIEQDIIDQAEEQIKDIDLAHSRAIILAGDGWNSGVIGLAASRLVERYNYPAIMLAGNGNELVGSCRSISGVDIFEVLKSTEDLLERFGGHAQAAGLTIKRDRLEEFILRVNEYLEEKIPPDNYIPSAEYDMDIPIGELTPDFISELNAINPTGCGNPAPVFRTQAVVTESKSVGKDGAHLRLVLQSGDIKSTAIKFRAGSQADELPSTVDVLYVPRLNEYQGRVSVQMELKAIKSADWRCELESAETNEKIYRRRFLTEKLYNIAHTAKAPLPVDAERIAEWLSESPRGTLIIAGDLDGLRDVLGGLGGRLDVKIGAYPDDPRGFNTACVYPVGPAPTGYDRIILAGAPNAFEVDGEVYRLGGLSEWIKELHGVEVFRECYRSFVRMMQRPTYFRTIDQLSALVASGAGVPQHTALAALLIFDDMDLIRLKVDGDLVEVFRGDIHKTDLMGNNMYGEISRWNDVTDDGRGRRADHE